jgi:hypothetical protein
MRVRIRMTIKVRVWVRFRFRVRVSSSSISIRVRVRVRDSVRTIMRAGVTRNDMGWSGKARVVGIGLGLRFW